MFPAQIIPNEYSICEERNQQIDQGKSLSPIQKTDAAMKGSVERALWNDEVLRALEYNEIAVHVRNGIVYLNGHIVSMSSQHRIEAAVRGIPGTVSIQNHLVLDDKLTLEVARSLGELEHTYGCKFFTGASHGIISLNGMVRDENVKSLAEKCASSNPNVRGVINNIRVSGAGQGLQEQPFLQPTIGEIIYFVDGVSGVVKQVIINPNNRLVVAMIVWGSFPDQRRKLKSIQNSAARAPERLVILPMDVVRYMTRDSGFLNINSNERNRFMEFESMSFRSPNVDWTPPYPYCPDDVLFPVEPREAKYQLLKKLPESPFVLAWEEKSLRKQLLANDSPGG